MQYFARCILVAMLCVPALAEQSSADYQRQIDEKKRERIELETSAKDLERELSQARRDRQAEAEARVSQARAKVDELEAEIKSIREEHTNCEVARWLRSGVAVKPADLKEHTDGIRAGLVRIEALNMRLRLVRNQLDFETSSKNSPSSAETRIDGELRRIAGQIQMAGSQIRSLESSKEAAAVSDGIAKAYKDGEDKRMAEKERDRAKAEKLEQQARDAEESRERREEERRQREQEQERARTRPVTSQDGAVPMRTEQPDPNSIKSNQVDSSTPVAKATSQLRASSGPRPEDIFLRPRPALAEPSVSVPSADPRAPFPSSPTAVVSASESLVPPSQLVQSSARVDALRSTAGAAMMKARESAANLMSEVLSNSADTTAGLVSTGSFGAGMGEIGRKGIQGYLEEKWTEHTRNSLADTLYGKPYSALSESERNDLIDREAARSMITAPGESQSAVGAFWDEHLSRRISNGVEDLMKQMGK